MRISETQQNVLDHLKIGHKLTCSFTEKDGYFDAMIEGVGSCDMVRISTLKALLYHDLIALSVKHPFGPGYWVTEFEEKRGQS